MTTTNETAECQRLPELLTRLGHFLHRYQQFEHEDAVCNMLHWQQALQQDLPVQGVGIDAVLDEMGNIVIPNGSTIPNPGSSAYITTGATSMGVLATLAGAVASPQRIGITAFNYLEELSLQWMAQLFQLPAHMKGVYSSGGSVANLLALGAARQQAYEQLGIDAAQDGITTPGIIFASAATHHTVQRAAAVLGLGRRSVHIIKSDEQGRMLPGELQQALSQHKDKIIIAVVANAGTTSTGAIDPLAQLGQLAHNHGVWFHVDGAYGLPGILDPRVTPLYQGLELADSVIVDPHKWLGAPVGIGATYVRDRALLQRAFTQEASDYLEGSLSQQTLQHSMDDLGIPYYDFGVELSAPARGAVVWALIREIGERGLRQRICRHNDMARYIAERARTHPNLEVVQEPTLSICCFRYVADGIDDLNALNKAIHRQLIFNNTNMPSTAMVDEKLALRPCFVGARALMQHAESLTDEVLRIGKQLTQEFIKLQTTGVAK